ncbi:MAG: hypothetical protein V5A45_09935 [Haloarculaceae archaeon]
MTETNYSEELATESLTTATRGIQQSRADLAEQMAALTAALRGCFK